MTHIGLTPRSQIRAAARRGIQQVRQVTPAEEANLNTGAAMSATTAGRTPIKKRSTHTFREKDGKKSPR